MIQLFLFFTTSHCWCPFLHQSITRQYSYEYYPYITDAQREAFIVGSIYADGYDKSLTHNLQFLKETVNQFHPDSELHWFFLGNYAHIISDVFAHAGKSKSFIVSNGIKHHLSEVIIDSLIVKKFNPPYLTISPTLQKSLEEIGVKFLRSFRFLYPLIRFATKLPLYKLLPKIQNDQCLISNLDLSICNFMNHYETMIVCMRDVYPELHNQTFTELKLKEESTKYLNQINCCDADSINLSITDNYDNGVYQPLLTRSRI